MFFHLIFVLVLEYNQKKLAVLELCLLHTQKKTVYSKTSNFSTFVDLFLTPHKNGYL